MSVKGLTVALGLSLVLTGCSTPCYLKPGEQVTFYPGYAYVSADQKSWSAVVQGRVVEPDAQSIFSKSALEALNSLSMFIPDVGASLAALQERLRPFAVKGHANTSVPIELQDTVLHLAKTTGDGYFEDRITLPQAPRLARGANISYKTQACAEDKRTFPGQAWVIPPTGLSVISDVEGSLQVSSGTTSGGSPAFAKVLLNEPKAVPGLAYRFTMWSAQGTLFHYVSASPWEWTSSVRQFLSENNFPEGSLHLQKLSWADANSSLTAAIAVLARVARPSTAHTGPVIEELLQRFPKRQFMLVGSSGDPTPELYAGLARRYPEQIRMIYIREVPGTTRQWAEVFQGIPSARWQVFTDPKSMRP
jgi:phosphatidate phosphatase APP1